MKKTELFNFSSEYHGKYERWSKMESNFMLCVETRSKNLMDNMIKADCWLFFKQENFHLFKKNSPIGQLFDRIHQEFSSRKLITDESSKLNLHQTTSKSYDFWKRMNPKTPRNLPKKLMQKFICKRKAIVILEYVARIALQICTSPSRGNNFCSNVIMCWLIRESFYNASYQYLLSLILCFSFGSRSVTTLRGSATDAIHKFNKTATTNDEKSNK